MKIATFNVNGINGRLPVLLRWLEEARPDIVCLQELKTTDGKFPIAAIKDAGYGAIWQGEKSWNGVAILARGMDPVETRRGLPGDPDDRHSRYLEAAVDGILIGCLYLPNGNPAPGPKFDYKLGWFDRFLTHAASLLAQDIPVILAGDYNVMPTELDVYKPEKWQDDALFRQEVRDRYALLVEKQGWVDAIRTLHPGERIYTFWDYLRNAYGRDAGLRLDHFLLSPVIAPRLKKSGVDREVRGWEKASDHAPAWIELASTKGRRTPAKKTAPKKKTAKAATAATDPPDGPLQKYRQKRDFEKTPEPAAKVPVQAGKSFVIQEHFARGHHFDFRLEIDGVLVSWAVPKGIPEDLQAKRLAVHVEDHPIEYGKFEGEIPKGNYGAGTVTIWDKGEWEPLETDWKKQLAKGTLKFNLRGDRLNGPYLLARMKEEPNWMLKMLNPATHPLPAMAVEREQAHFISPQLAHVVPTVPTGAEWIHELKYDGYRLIVVKRDGVVKIFTRSELDWTDRFQKLAAHLSRVSGKDFVLDGEALVWDEKGRSSFGALQEALKGRGEEISFVAFDLLHFDGENLRNLPLSERQKRLADLVSEEAGPVRRSRTWASREGGDLYQQACRLDLEGIVSKNLHGRYLEGSRREWVKSKCRPRQEFVICGYTPPKSSLPAFSSIVLGSYENGKWIHRGKVGTGFSESDRVALLERFRKIVSKKKLFETVDRNVVWMEPQLVAEIEYAELTRDGSIRQGSFIGLREDKAAADVRLEGVQTALPDGKDAKVLGIKVSHPERVVFPAEGITKLEVVRYFERVAELMLPYVKNRPLSLLRAPSGISGELFFQKSFPNHIPEHVHQVQLEDKSTVFHIKDARGLVSLAQFGMVEVHPWGAPLPQGDRPDFLTWDLDPDSSVPWKEVLGTALLLRDFLSARGLDPLVKTSGGKGLHVMIHLKRGYGWDVLKPFSKAVAEAVAAYNPHKLITTSTKAKRVGKIYIDWLRNGRGATCIAPWGLRARPGATVSMPIGWDQLPEIASAGFTIHEPPETPPDWIDPRPRTLRKAVLRELINLP